MAGDTLLDIPHSVRESHPDLARVFDCSNALMETLTEIWSVSTPLIWEIRKSAPSEIQKWLDAVNRLPSQLDEAECTLSPVAHEIFRASKGSVRIYGDERSVASEAIVALGNSVLGVISLLPLLDDPDQPMRSEQAREGVAKTLQSVAETHPNTVSWGNLRSILRNEITSVAAQRQSSPPKTLFPKAYLQNWAEILDALGLENNETNKGRIQRANERFSGPIRIPKGRGSQPFAEKTKLIAWYNGLEDRYEELARRENDKQATVAKQHEYGRDGTVVPDIHGSVKKRKPKK